MVPAQRSAVHERPSSQLTHSAPPYPHAPDAVPGSHTDPRTQPAHEQTPFVHDPEPPAHRSVSSAS